MTTGIVYIIGFLAQMFFSARILVQWILSERAQRVLSPALFWVFSVAGAYLMCIYGWLRHDFSIVLGQIISYYIYLWNLKEKNLWEKMPVFVRWILAITPVVALCFVMQDASAVLTKFFRNDKIPLWLVVYGSLGQVIFTLRFVYQWYYSHRRHESVLPAGFWIISLTGSAAIVSYAIIRHDPVLIVGQSFGLIAYTRNLCLLHKTNSTLSCK